MGCNKKYVEGDYDSDYYGGRQMAKKMNNSISGLALGKPCERKKKRSCKK